MNLLFSNYCSCLKHCGGMIWLHETLDLTPALLRKKSSRDSFSVPPRASYHGHKVNNSVSLFQPGHPVRNTSLLTGPIKEIQTFRIYGSLVQMSCSLVSRRALLSIQWDLGWCGGRAVPEEGEWWENLRAGVASLPLSFSKCSVPQCPSSWVFTEGQAEERECQFHILTEGGLNIWSMVGRAAMISGTAIASALTDLWGRQG